MIIKKMLLCRRLEINLVPLLCALILIIHESHQASASAQTIVNNNSKKHSVRQRPSLSGLLKRALLSTLSSATVANAVQRTSKWNEFMEEAQNNNKQSTNSKNTTSASSSSPTGSMFDDNIVMSSNLGQATPTGGSAPNRPKEPLNPVHSHLMNKLFNSAFLTAPSRVMSQSTKRPLVTYVNVSNLEEHEEASSQRLSQVSLDKVNELPLLNNADSIVGNSNNQKKRLPECVTQQVCAAHYVKSNHTQSLCECPAEFNWNCIDPKADHTIELSNNPEFNRVRNSSFDSYTQVRMCENLKTLKPCKQPTDWTIMALQSERTAKAHYVVACKCPETALFEGPFTHKHPPYARYPGIRVYGMLCNQGNRKYKEPKAMEIDDEKNPGEYPRFPWELAYAVLNATSIDW